MRIAPHNLPDGWRHVEHEPIEVGTFASVREEDEYWLALCACGYESDGYPVPVGSRQ